MTAGQISGPKTPPAHRQQELWNTVFGDNYQEMDEDDEERGRPMWLFALLGSVLVALVGALVWAFVAGPLSSGGGSATDTTPTSTPAASKSTTATKPQSVPTLPKFKGTPSPVTGVVSDPASKIAVSRLGGSWQLDLRTQHIQTTYGFTTRQYVSAGLTNVGKPQFAQVMSGPLPQALASKYTTPDNLSPVISAVAFQARQKMFPKGNKSTKIAQQNITRDGMTGRLIAYKVTDDGGSTTVVVAAINAGADLPSIVYMQVPDVKDDLLPDINTIFKSIKRA